MLCRGRWDNRDFRACLSKQPVQRWSYPRGSYMPIDIYIYILEVYYNVGFLYLIFWSHY